MRCPRCREEVLLAKTCPYCGAVVPVTGALSDDDEAGGARSERPSDPVQHPEEGFRGPTGDGAPPRRGPWATVTGAVRYLFDPRVPVMRKAFIIGALLYLISPLDVVPDLLPVFGWLDDAAVAVALWGFLNGEIGRYLGHR